MYTLSAVEYVLTVPTGIVCFTAVFKTTATTVPTGATHPPLVLHNNVIKLGVKGFVMDAVPRFLPKLPGLGVPRSQHAT